MPIQPGVRLGPYEIQTALGAGGMGEVYRATDTNLKRAVAIKVLPASVAADAERLARFQREAEVLASLNHPNIAGIYGLERSDGTTALVMELVEGPTLADRISERPIPVDEALPIAKQIAEALQAAHEQGIIHRDLKPANIKLRLDGTVKVLDFGLAKAMEPTGAMSPGLSRALHAAELHATRTVKAVALMTTSGTIGTGVPTTASRARSKATARSVPAAPYTRWPRLPVVALIVNRTAGHVVGVGSAPDQRRLRSGPEIQDPLVQTPFTERNAEISPDGRRRTMFDRHGHERAGRRYVGTPACPLSSSTGQFLRVSVVLTMFWPTVRDFWL